MCTELTMNEDGIEKSADDLEVSLTSRRQVAKTITVRTPVMSNKDEIT